MDECDNFIEIMQKLSLELDLCFANFLSKEKIIGRPDVETKYLLDLIQSAFITSMNNLMCAAAKLSDNPYQLEKVEKFQSNLMKFLSSQMKTIVIINE